MNQICGPKCTLPAVGMIKNVSVIAFDRHYFLAISAPYRPIKKARAMALPNATHGSFKTNYL